MAQRASSLVGRLPASGRLRAFRFGLAANHPIQNTFIRTRGYVDDRFATARLAVPGPWTTADEQTVDRLRLTTHLTTGYAHRPTRRDDLSAET